MKNHAFFLILPALLFGLSAPAQNDKDIRVSGSAARRIAVVVGNQSYRHAPPLATAGNDARGMRDALKQLGFEVLFYEDATQAELNQSLRDLTGRLQNNRYLVALFYFSGHGLQVNGENFLVPVDADPLIENEVPYLCLNGNRITAILEGMEVPTKILLLDACRNNPFGKSWRKSVDQGGLATMNAPAGTFIGFAAAPGSIALDGSAVGLSYSPYTAAILEHIRTPGISIFQVFTRVAKTTNQIASARGLQQSPWMNASLQDDFYFAVSDKPAAPPAPAPENAPATAPASFTDPLAGAMVLVGGGVFQMGSASSQSAANPVHSVTLSNYYIGQYEVTQAIWRKVMGSDPPKLFHPCDQCPVNNVSWEDIQTFLVKLNAKTGRQYRLPTEAEWEYAARGGGNARGFAYAGSDNVGEVAWFEDNSGGFIHPVGRKRANELGVYDMSGNVYEFCSDWHENYSPAAQTDPPGAPSGLYRVIRGGWSKSVASTCLVWERLPWPVTDPVFGQGGDFLGFRLALSAQ